MINVDTVYQRVLALANKEQRGYITPQEFNLFANQAQNEILKEYFYDMSMWERVKGNELEYSDNLNLIDEKLSPFKRVGNVTGASGLFNVNAVQDFYKLGAVFNTQGNREEIEEVNFDEFRLLSKSPLTQPTLNRPVYYWVQGQIQVAPANGINQIQISYIVRPTDVEWGYVVISNKALYNAATAVNFQLHPSEESRLVYKILALAGITLQDPGFYQIARAEDDKSYNQQKQ